MNSTTPTSEILKDFSNVIIGNIYTLPTPIRVKSLPVKSGRTYKLQEVIRERNFLRITVLEKKENEIICTGHKVHKLESGNLKSNKRKYIFSLSKDFKFN